MLRPHLPKFLPESKGTFLRVDPFQFQGVAPLGVEKILASHLKCLLWDDWLCFVDGMCFNDSHFGSHTACFKGPLLSVDVSLCVFG